MSSKLTGKVALITGANKGIGLEIARQLGAQGITVLIGARDEQRGREASQKLKAEQIDAQAVQLDVTDQATIDAAASQIENKFGKLDILVNNAGIALDREPPSQLDIEVLRRSYETNFFSIFSVLLTLASQTLRRQVSITRALALAASV